MKKEKKPLSKTKRIVLIVCGVLLLAALGIGGKFVYTITHPDSAFDFDQPAQMEEAVVDTPDESAEPANADASGAPTPTPTIDPAILLEQQADKDFMQKRVTILALGYDESAERADWGSYRTDAMILITVNFDTNKVDMVSIPRDSYVKIYKKKEPSYERINTAFSVGGGVDKHGFEYSMKTVSMLLGDIPIKYYVGFNMSVVKDVVNAMGGVDYNVDTEVTMNGRVYHPGMQHLDGQGVLDYCRQRKGSSDIARIDRQQRVLLAIFDQMKQTNQIVNIPKIYNAVSTNMHTNLTMTQISALALFANKIGLENIARHQINGEPLPIGKIAYWGLSQKSIQKVVKDMFGVSIPFRETEDVAYIKKQLEENHQRLLPKLNVADAWLKHSAALTKGQGSLMTADEKNALETVTRNLQNAFDEEDEELLDAAIPAMEQTYNAIALRLGQPTFSSYGVAAPTPVASIDPLATPAAPTPTPSSPAL